MNSNNELKVGEYFKIPNCLGYTDVSPAGLYMVTEITSGGFYNFRDDVGEFNCVLCSDVSRFEVESYMVVRAIDLEIDNINKEIEKVTAELRGKIEALKTTRKIFTI